MTHSRTASQHRGFTLVEMLVTIALVVVLMLAVTQIFSIASRTISGGQALGSSTRDAQSAQAVFARDFAACSADGAYFNIYMGRIPSFRDRDDLDSDRGDLDPMTVDLDNDGTAETTISPVAYNFRNHRSDSIAFFARDRYPRQTGNDGTLVADMSSNEAAIFYHHLQLPDNSFNFSANTYPGQGNPNSNPNNYFSSQWILGRTAMLMVEPDSNAKIMLGSQSQEYIKRSSEFNLWPLSKFSQATQTGYTIGQSRFDLVGMSLDNYKLWMADWLAMPANANKAWWLDIMGGTNHFQASVYAPRPLTAAAAAQQLPIFVPACSQFIVEFAGDFITQKADGSIDDSDTTTHGIAGDGVIDFVKGTHQIRWYGLPRDSNGDGKIRGDDGDVVPVCDVTGKVMNFERQWPTSGTTAPTSIPGLGKDYYTQVTDLQANPGYVVAWPPIPADASINDAGQRWKFFRPQMIRITLGIDRPEGHLPDGTSFEYVFKVGL